MEIGVVTESNTQNVQKHEEKESFEKTLSKSEDLSEKLKNL